MVAWFGMTHPRSECHYPPSTIQKKFGWSETFSNSTLGMHPKYEFFCRNGFPTRNRENWWHQKVLNTTSVTPYKYKKISAKFLYFQSKKSFFWKSLPTKFFIFIGGNGGGITTVLVPSVFFEMVTGGGDSWIWGVTLVNLCSFSTMLRTYVVLFGIICNQVFGNSKRILTDLNNVSDGRTSLSYRRWFRHYQSPTFRSSTYLISISAGKQMMSPRLKFCRQHQNFDINFTSKFSIPYIYPNFGLW